jgi:hypothetical protein
MECPQCYHSNRFELTSKDVEDRRSAPGAPHGGTVAGRPIPEPVALPAGRRGVHANRVQWLLFIVLYNTIDGCAS